ncbi:hypothetical protein HDU96_010097 [Phlyctochytrium bullatum]|nr:hypothetical protein HDU96_010097 [Phlyctochytrium bullatum]
MQVTEAVEPEEVEHDEIDQPIEPEEVEPEETDQPVEPETIEALPDYPITFQCKQYESVDNLTTEDIGDMKQKKRKRLSECRVDRESMINLLLKKVCEEAGREEGVPTVDQVVTHIGRATKNDLKHLKHLRERSKESADVHGAFKDNIMRILDELDEVRVSFLEKMGLAPQE